MADIFLSYARADQPTAAKIAAALEAAGHSVWWDQHLASGHDFSEDIERELEAARAVVVLWSATSVKSHWVRDEAAYGQRAGKLIPASIDGSEPPMGYRQLHTTTVDADKPGPLVAAVGAFLSGEAPRPAPPPAAPKPKKKPSKWAIAGIAAIAIAGATGLLRPDVWDRFGGSGEQAIDAKIALALIPFAALSSGEEDSFFARGLGDDIANKIGQDPRISFVNPQASANATHRLEGSVRRSGERFRVTAKLVDAGGRTLWSRDYDPEGSDLIAIQADLSDRIAAAVSTLLDPASRERMAELEIAPDNPEALIAFDHAVAIDTGLHGEGDYMGLIDATRAYDEAFALAPSLWDAKLRSMDYYGHLVQNHAAGDRTISAAQVEEALAQLRTRSVEAARAHPTGRAAGAEFLAAMASDDWRGVGELLDLIIATDCPTVSWGTSVAHPFGRARSSLARLIDNPICERRDANFFGNIALAHLFLGQPKDALAAIQTDRAGQSNGATDEWVRVRVYLANGMIDEARTAALRIDPAAVARQYAAAAINRMDPGGRPLAIDEKAVAGMDLADRAALAALQGDKELANRLAAEIDAHPGGPFVLITIPNTCGCGPAFDIDQTPNLKRQLAQAGLQWPPRDAIGINR